MMLSSALERRLLFWLPLSVLFIGITTLIVCLIITKVNNIYTGGLVWSYFSDMGRDEPAYFIFSIGFTIGGIILGFVWYLNYKFLRTECQESTKAEARKLSRAVLVIGIMATLGLPTLAIFDTGRYDTVHRLASYWAIFFSGVAAILNTYTSKILLESYRMNCLDADSVSIREKQYMLQVAIVVLFWIAMIIYLPVGLALIPANGRLTVEQCLANGYSDKYCKEEVKYDDDPNLTRLWNYEDYSPVINQLRAASQLVIILTALGYVTSMSMFAYTKSTKITSQASSPNGEYKEEV